MNLFKNFMLRLSEMFNNVELSAIELVNGGTLTQESESFNLNEMTYVQDVDGNITPATGSYEGLDGNIYTVDEAGKLVSIEPKEVETEENTETEPTEVVEDVEEETPVETPEVVVEDTPSQEMMDLMTENDSLKQEVESLKAELESLKAELEMSKTKSVELSSELEQLKELPLAVEFSKQSKIETKTLTKDEQRVEMLKQMSKAL